MTRTDSPEHVQAVVFPTKLGWIAAAWADACIHRLTFGHGEPRRAWQQLELDQEPAQPDAFLSQIIERLEAFAAGHRGDTFLDIKLATNRMTDFQQAVIRTCRQIPAGQTQTYGELAARVGHPRAARAVGTVMANNRFPLLVPCHRVVAAGGGLGGFSSPQGLAMKRRLLAPEIELTAAQ